MSFMSGRHEAVFGGAVDHVLDETEFGHYRWGELEWCWASIRLHTDWSLKAIVSIPRSLPVFVVGEEGVKVESPQRSEENRP
jgi:hypothetical protein